MYVINSSFVVNLYEENVPTRVEWLSQFVTTLSNTKNHLEIFGFTLSIFVLIEMLIILI